MSPFNVTYEPASYVEVYQRHWAGQIYSLLQHPDNHPIALMSMFSCMEMAMRVEQGTQHDSRNRIFASKMMMFYFGESEKYQKLAELFGKKLGDNMFHAIKHTGFLRQGIYLWDSPLPDGEGKPVRDPMYLHDGKLIVAPTAFWHFVSRKIERIMLAKGDSPLYERREEQT